MTGARTDAASFLERYGDPIFVAGTQRSGTTLLCRMLSAHRDIYVKNELADAARTFREGSAESVVGELDAAVAETAIGTGLAEHLASTGKTRWGLKDPALSQTLFRIPALFPRARTIITVRDGRAVTLSYLRQRWGSAGNVFGGARRWAREIQMQEAFVALNPGRAIFVRYEDLVRDPETTLAGLCEFLGTAFDETMLAYHEVDSEIRRHAGNENAFRPVDPALIDKWRADLPARHVRLFEGLAGDVLERHGYTLTAPPIRPGALKMGLLAVQNYLLTELQQQLRWRFGAR